MNKTHESFRWIFRIAARFAVDLGLWMLIRCSLHQNWRVKSRCGNCRCYSWFITQKYTECTKRTRQLGMLRVCWDCHSRLLVSWCQSPSLRPEFKSRQGHSIPLHCVYFILYIELLKVWHVFLKKIFLLSVGLALTINYTFSMIFFNMIVSSVVCQNGNIILLNRYLLTSLV